MYKYTNSYIYIYVFWYISYLWIGNNKNGIEASRRVQDLLGGLSLLYFNTCKGVKGKVYVYIHIYVYIYIYIYIHINL
jgi:hypothetical protein